MQTRKNPKAPKTSAAAANANANSSKTRKDLVCNFSPPEFVDCIRDAALSVSAVNSEDSVRLRSWVFALHSNPLPAHQMLLPDSTKKKKRACDNHNALQTESSGTGASTLKEDDEAAAAASAKRERKKSKYLSPPYTDIRGSPIQNQSEEKLHVTEIEIGGLDKANTMLGFDACSVPDIFNDFLLTANDPLYLKRRKSAKVLRIFFEKYRDTMFVEGAGYGGFANHKCGCKMKGEPVKINADLDNGSVSALASSPQSRLSPKMARSDLTPGQDVSRVEEELETETGEDKTDNGAHQSKKRGRPRKEEKGLSSSGSIMPGVEQSEQKNEKTNLTGSVSSVTYQTNINVGLETVLNFSNGSCDFLEEARAQMMKTSTMGKGYKLAGTGKQSQEQGSSNKRNTGNGDATCDTGPKQRGRKKKIAQAHYPNPAALLLDFSKPNATNGAAIGMGTDLPSRDQLLSTFSKFGLLVEAQSLVYPDAHTARVVFARSADAEVAYNSPDKLGPFGAPYASCRLHYLPPISDLTTPAQRAQAHQLPAQQLSAKPQLSDIRKNLEMMISSLTGGSGLPVKQEPGSALDGIRPEVRGLLGEMQGLLMKVDKRLGNCGASSCAPQP
ncbi:hypothetical protein LUZ61_004421 [Rhynchospora tenuis]|uniref:Uncharacterized protein n=1 Tax=Rhynchospora tenuis TaxID=198213 RepID=A0AAD5ZMT5_9POAL|nr:hypothetical protein LUZ61_004421 [Rhynchospora tenuis]